MRASISAAPAMLLAGVLSSHPAAAMQQTFVASYGDDSNPDCTFTAPCRSFAAALGATDSGGEVVALDTAGYGPVTITRSVSIVATPGVYASIASSGNAAVTIDTPNGEVVLRGLSVNGVGTAPQFGVYLINGASLSVENCVISGFMNIGLAAAAPAAVSIADSTFRNNGHGVVASHGAALDVSRSRFIGNSQYGVYVSGAVPGTTTRGTVTDSIATGNSYGFAAANTFNDQPGHSRLAIIRSTASNNTFGVAARVYPGAGTAIVAIAGSLVVNNGTGLLNANGVLESWGDNKVRQNDTDTSGAITPAKLT